MAEFITTERAKEILAPLAPDQRRIALQKLAERGHEIEGFNTSFSPLNAVKNIPGSLVEFGKNIAKSVVDIKSDERGVDFDFTLPGTLKAVANLGLGAAIKLAETVGGDPENSIGASILKAAGGDLDEARKTAEAFGGFFQQRYGSKQKVLETIERDPAGFLADLSSLVSGGAGGVAKIAGTTGKLGKIGRAAETVASVGRKLEPLSATGKTISKTVKAAKPLAEPILAKIHQASGIRKLVSKAEARSLGITLGEQAKIGEKAKIADAPGALARLGVEGTMPQMSQQLEDIASSTRKFLNDKLASVPGKVKSPAAQKTVLAMIDEIEKLPQKLRAADYNAMRAEAATFRDRLSPGRQGLNLTDLNRVKKMGDELFNIYTEGGRARQNLRAQNLAKIRSGLRRQIEDVAEQAGFGEVQKLNQNIALAETTKRYVDLAIKKMPARRKNLFFDLATGATAGGAAVATGNMGILLGAAFVTGAQRLATNPKFLSAFANKLASISDADFTAIERMIRKQKPTVTGRRAVRKMLRDLQPAFPEIRLASLTRQETEKENQKQ